MDIHLNAGKKRLEELTLALEEAGLRLTPQRMAICRLLADTGNHPTAQEIYDEIKPDFHSLSLATVYNTLESLVSLGVVNALGGAGDGAIHYDADLDPHVNLACISCHQVVDLPSEYVQSLSREVSHGSGYQILGARVLYYGLCPSCQEKQSKGE